MMFTELLAPGHEHHLMDQPVRVCGLNSRPEINGKTGTTVDWVQETQRFGVEIDGVGSLSIRPANLQLNWRKGEPIPARGKKNQGAEPTIEVTPSSPRRPCTGSASAPDVVAPAEREYTSLAEQLAHADLMAAEEERGGEDGGGEDDGGQPSKKGRRRRKKGKSGGGSGDGSLEAFGNHVEELSQAQSRIQEAFAEFEVLQQRVAALEKLKPNTAQVECRPYLFASIVRAYFNSMVGVEWLLADWLTPCRVRRCCGRRSEHCAMR